MLGTSFPVCLQLLKIYCISKVCMYVYLDILAKYMFGEENIITVLHSKEYSTQRKQLYET